MPPSPLPAPAERCRNCGRELHGEYCSHCGQEHVESNAPAGELFREFLKDEFHFDFRIVRTILPLLFRPGFLTAEYLSGRRVRYVPPLRMYVFISVALFALVAASAKSGRINGWGIRNQHGRVGAATDSTAGKASWHFSFGNDTTVAWTDPALPAEEVRETLAAALDREEPDSMQGGFAGRMRAGLVKTLHEPEAFIEAALEHTAQAMFIVMPLVALLLKLLYLRRQRRYMEHLIFTLHVHAYVFLVLALALGAALTGWAPLAAATRWLLWTIPVYAFIALRRVYGQGMRKTLAKYLLLGTGYFVLLIPTLVAVVMVSLILL